MAAPSKDELRARLRSDRARIAPDRARGAAIAAAANLLRVEPVHSAHTIALYAAFRDELDTAPLFERLTARGTVLLFPRVAERGGPLTFHPVRALATLVAGRYGILEPPSDAPSVPLENIDVVVVPGLGFDLRGGRLGWGGGYYDRSFAQHPRRVRVGYCYEQQLVDQVPSAATDLPMHHIVTESRAVAVPLQEG